MEYFQMLILKNNKILKKSENLKNLYSTQAQAGIDTFEVNYWSEKGYFDKTLEDVLD